MPIVNVGQADDFAEETVTQVVVGERYLAIYRLAGGDLCATSDICTHGQSFLSDGWITDEGAIECALHGGCFDIRTGKGLGAPIEKDLETYPIRVGENGEVLVELGD